MADITGSWNRVVNMRPVDPNEKLFLFGYSCKVFRDDEKAVYIDQGKHLIPWMGDEKLMIDRYDVRGYLHDLKQYEPPISGTYEDPYLEEEKLCDEERYRSLRTDVSEEQLYQEEELKRLRAAIASDGAYHEIGFTYDNAESEKYEQPETSKVEEPEDELYQVPAGLKVPKGMEVPYNMKIHTIIEKTAQFVSEQGGQMEIIIKMKQHANPQFGFMHLDNPLYPYYKHLAKEIKSGSYKPVQIKKAVSHSEDDDDDGHYLHPSLMSGRTEDVPKFTVPSINFRRNHDDSYSVLVRNLRQHLVEETPAETQSSSAEASQEGHTKNHLISICSDESSCDEYQNSSVQTVELIPPPPDLQPIIHKMAEYVAKNGEDFETIVKSKNDNRFAFLHPWNEYYQYYILKRDEAKGKITEIVKQNEQPSVQATVSDSSKSASDPIQDSGTDAVSPTDNKEENQVAASCENETMDSQDSQGSIFGPNPQPSQEVPKEDQTDSMESLDSQSSVQSAHEGVKSKSKSIKAPISFSLKVKESETPTSDKSKMTTLLLDDSEDDSDENKTDKVESNKRRKSTEDSRSAPNSRHESVEREEKTTKQNNESLEAKLAEERIKDKLVAAARERIAQQKKEKQMQLEQQKREELLKKERQAQLEQQRKEKQLQLERKRKAALFLKMLEKKNPDSNITASQKLGEKKEIKQQNFKKPDPDELDSDFWILPDAAGASDNGIVFPSDKMYIPSGQNFPLTVQGLKHAWATNSFSGESGEEEPITEYGEKHSSDSEPTPPKVEEVTKPEKQKKKKKKRSHSKSRERSRSDRSKTSRRSRERHRSRSPIKNHKEKSKRDKELPAAYSYKRSRSRSRSPRRYRPGPSHWSRRR
ncbi:Splicing factor, suppressor of white-apricot-like protein, partial [Stegodyphus mimosarum]